MSSRAELRDFDDLPPAAGPVAAARKYERVPLPDSEGTPGLSGPDEPVPAVPSRPPRIMTMVLVAIALALAIGYFIFA